MADSLQSLVNTKAALDLNLVTQADYEKVKSAFLKAQQLRTAMDSGLISQEDFDTNKSKYLASLTLQDPAPIPTAAAAPVQRVPSPNGVARTAPEAPAFVAAPPPRAPAPPPPAPPAPPVVAAAAIPALVSNSAPVSRSSSAASIPSNIPKFGGAKALSNGVSMSGIGVSEDAVNLYYFIRAKSAYKWALWKVDTKGTTVVIDQVGEPASNFQEFIAALPENDCRYGSKFNFQGKKIINCTVLASFF
jgi:cofilin